MGGDAYIMSIVQSHEPVAFSFQKILVCISHSPIHEEFNKITIRRLVLNDNYETFGSVIL